MKRVIAKPPITCDDPAVQANGRANLCHILQELKGSIRPTAIPLPDRVVEVIYVGILDPPRSCSRTGGQKGKTSR